MKKVILGLIIGLAIGYKMGYSAGAAGEPPAWKKALDKFGVSRMRDENARQQQIMDSVSRAR